MEKRGGIVQPIWSVFLDEIVGCMVSGKIEEGRNEDVNILLQCQSLMLRCSLTW